ncbi:MAG TPA: aspartate aminotransferase family protein [Phycicoccus sp.]|nr:aspartate aminotransferase family protein [Phycicoccus sp.]HQH06289.1 aspartate aminotransferase family protein [Phycicoccus sp.]HQK30735.1 aspartate aminotransferase family protein [Phycicoccus sp.]
MTDPLAFDREHLWHPYGSALTPSDPYLVESAHGIRIRLRDRDGRPREVIDAMSSWWCAIHGYAVPQLDAAAHSQLGRMSHVMFGGLTHEPAVELGRRLVESTPDGLKHVFFADSGSVAVEVAMKMALQFQIARGERRTRFFTIRGGYHGDTFSPMSVTDPVGGMHSLFRGVLPEHVFAPRPPAGFDCAADDPTMVAWEAETRALYAAHAPDIAAVIVEPVLQGAGGMHIYSPYAVSVLQSLAREHGALVIHDEIATGFHRTGPMWAADHAERLASAEPAAMATGPADPTGESRAVARQGVPDILCVGKALTGGYLSLAAVLCTHEVAVGVSRGEAGGLMHGPTFMANPLACAIAAASLDLLRENDAATQVARIRDSLAAGLAPARELESVVDVRTIGAVGVIQLREPVRVADVTAAAIARGVWVRPFRDLVYTMPPYVTSDDDLTTLNAALVDAVRATHG